MGLISGRSLRTQLRRQLPGERLGKVIEGNGGRTKYGSPPRVYPFAFGSKAPAPKRRDQSGLKGVYLSWLKSHAAKAAQKGIDLRFEPGTAPTDVVGDPLRLRQIVARVPGGYQCPFGTGVAVADFNGDGRPDAAINATTFGPTTGREILVLLGKGDGAFQPPLRTPVDSDVAAGAVVAADLNGDGILDLVVASQYYYYPYPPFTNWVTVLLGNGDGTFRVGAKATTGASPISLAVGDFNGDGKVDVAVADSGSDDVSVLLGNGDGTFAAAISFAVGHTPQAVAAADFDGDGKLDLVVVNRGSDSVSVLLGNAHQRTKCSRL